MPDSDDPCSTFLQLVTVKLLIWYAVIATPAVAVLDDLVRLEIAEHDGPQALSGLCPTTRRAIRIDADIVGELRNASPGVRHPRSLARPPESSCHGPARTVASRCA